MIGNEIDPQELNAGNRFGLKPPTAPMQGPVQPQQAQPTVTTTTQRQRRVATPTPQRQAAPRRVAPTQTAPPRATPTPQSLVRMPQPQAAATPPPTPQPTAPTQDFFGLRPFGGTPRPQGEQQAASQPKPQESGGSMTGFLEPDYERYLKQMLRAHEGTELKAYPDSEGYMTIGIGHRLEQGTTPQDVWNAYQAGKPISRARAEELFEQDYVKHAKEAAKYVPNFNNLPYNQKMAFIDMVFNLGGGGFNKFKKLKAAIAAGDVNAMVREMQNSKWYNQVGDRARNLIHLVQTGQMRKNNNKKLPMLPQVQAQAQALATKAARDTQPKPKVPGLMDTFMTPPQ